MSELEERDEIAETIAEVLRDCRREDLLALTPPKRRTETLLYGETSYTVDEFLEHHGFVPEKAKP